MKLHNTLTRSNNDFTALTEGTARIYSCGPTVYDNIHIGNLLAFVAADTLRRVLSLDHNVKHVMNFTDIDDKTIARSKTEFPDLKPMDALQALTVKYSDVFMNDMRAIGNDIEAISFVRATDSIEGMKSLIRELHAQGFAYVTDDGVYFSIQKYKDAGNTYGQLTTINSENTSNERIQNDEYDKDSAHDFALWKRKKDGEPAWEFDLDGNDLLGRPGWHIECSVMSTEQLGAPFDIHTGGIDLVFPHHENEIAQSTAGGSEYACTFVHNEHLLVDGKKMSKSLQNFYTLRDIEDSGYNPLVFRVLALQSHYRSQTNFSWDSIGAASSRLFDYRMTVDFAAQPVFNPVIGVNSVESFTQARHDFIAALQNDLDTPQALAIVSKVFADVKKHNAIFTDATAVSEFKKFLELIDTTLGLNLSTRPTLNEAAATLIRERETAKATKDWQRADEIRAQLSDDMGVMISDSTRADSTTRTLWFNFNVY